MAKRTEKKSADTESLLHFYDYVMSLYDPKDGQMMFSHDDVVAAINAQCCESVAMLDKQETILRTLRRWRPRKIKD